VRIKSVACMLASIALAHRQPCHWRGAAAYANCFTRVGNVERPVRVLIMSLAKPIAPMPCRPPGGSAARARALVPAQDNRHVAEAQLHHRRHPPPRYPAGAPYRLARHKPR
jgi:hypothetical protein